MLCSLSSFLCTADAQLDPFETHRSLSNTPLQQPPPNTNPNLLQAVQLASQLAS